jgi:predicted DNA-binding protein
MQTLTLKVSAELSDWLDKQAKQLNRSKSEIVRRALEAQRGGINPESVLARAGDLVGKYASGKKDSSHKKHLKGLGSCNRF